jgi:NADH dehydrogenase FAD-containing subunit
MPSVVDSVDLVLSTCLLEMIYLFLSYRFEQRIAAFAETKFLRDGIEVNTGFRVIKISDDLITVKSKASGGETLVPYGMVVWSAGIGTRPVITDFMNQVGQVDKSESKLHIQVTQLCFTSTIQLIVYKCSLL